MEVLGVMQQGQRIHSLDGQRKTDSVGCVGVLWKAYVCRIE
jgi:hypothetical protein